MILPSQLRTAEIFLLSGIVMIINLATAALRPGYITARIRRFQNRLTISAANSYLFSDLLAGNRHDAFWIFTFDQGNGTVRGQKIGKTGELQGATLIHKLDPADSLFVHDVSIADIFTGQFFITFLRYHRGDTEVFSQRFDQNLQPLSVPLKVNMDQFSAWQNTPLVCFNRQGGSIVLWEDHRNGRYDLYAQVYDPDFNPLGSNRQINDPAVRYTFFGDKHAGALTDGTFMIAFCGTENINEGNIYLQAIDPQGYKTGTNVKVNEDYNPNQVRLKVDAQDQILVCWYNRSSAGLRKYNKNLTAVSPIKTL